MYIYDNTGRYVDHSPPSTDEATNEESYSLVASRLGFVV